jgi:cell division protease FtsH
MARSGGPEQRDGPPRSSSREGLWVWLTIGGYTLFGALAILGWGLLAERDAARSIPYSEFKAHLARGEVQWCALEQDRIRGRIAPGPGGAAPGAEADAAAGAGAAFEFRTVRVDDPGLVAELIARGVKFEGVAPPALGPGLLGWLVPVALIAGLWLMISQRMRETGAGMAGFAKSHPRLTADRQTGVTFDDVAGCDEAKQELHELIEFLRDPERYRALGAHIPKGVLLVGPPGTGKTLLARAVAGEARVPFLSLSGSEFVELFVGVGAARVRDLFEQAKRQAPCIVFIDELDAVGRHRGVHVVAGNDEREQTLNQLLVEMDGFESNAGVILLAATNRPETLDRALLRPGRFDRQIVLDAPDAAGRTAILRVHTRGKPLADDVNLEKIALATPGFSGADLANVVNEAALLAARLRSREISHAHLEESVEKVVAGPERKSRRLSDDDKRRVAYHEVGHALVAAFSSHADPVRKISIVPRGRAALGYTLQLPTGDQLLLTRSELLDRIRGLLGGRAAEELALGEVSTGAHNDLAQATALAREMVARHGMGQSAGLMECAPDESPYLPGAAGARLDCSDATAREIDAEVKELLAAAYADARRLLEKHGVALDRIARELLRRETLDAAEFQRLLELPATPAPPA